MNKQQEQKIEQMLSNNPYFSRAKEMAKGKTENEIKQICSNICKQRGFSFDQMFGMFQNFLSSMM